MHTISHVCRPLSGLSQWTGMYDALLRCLVSAFEPTEKHIRVTASRNTCMCSAQKRTNVHMESQLPLKAKLVGTASRVPLRNALRKVFIRTSCELKHYDIGVGEYPTFKAARAIRKHEEARQGLDHRRSR